MHGLLRVIGRLGQIAGERRPNASNGGFLHFFRVSYSRSGWSADIPLDDECG
jgi:hypothetical protein